MKKRCNMYIEETNVEYLHMQNINISQLTDNFLATYVDLLRKSEDELVLMRKEIEDEIIEKTMKLKMIDKRILELADEVTE